MASMMPLLGAATPGALNQMKSCSATLTALNTRKPRVCRPSPSYDDHYLVIGDSLNTGIDDMPVESWRRMIDVNLSGTFYCLKAAIPAMKRNRYGRTVLFGSNIALKGRAGIAHYGAAKGGVHALSRCTALDWPVTASP
jgi:NAD(P)-dependent dehydrogenase (short-subunit alcohol dehydrogenase family)